MATAMTYNSLLASLRRYLERGNSVDTQVFEELPHLINRAERDIADKLKILGTLNVVTAALQAGLNVYAKPDRWRQTASINFGRGTGFAERTPIHPRAYEFCRTYWPVDSEEGEPEFYSDYGYYHWLIVPTPDQAYPFEANFWELPAMLDDSNQTNWLTDYAPNALLNGTLLKCAPFLKNDERIPVWQQAYESDLMALDGSDLQRIIDRTTVRNEV